MTGDNRKDLLTAQRVQVGLVFKEMLGVDDAAAYLRNSGVAESVIVRVLADSAWAIAGESEVSLMRFGTVATLA